MTRSRSLLWLLRHILWKQLGDNTKALLTCHGPSAASAGHMKLTGFQKKYWICRLRLKTDASKSSILVQLLSNWTDVQWQSMGSIVDSHARVNATAMATASVSDTSGSYPELNIVLFNVSSSDVQVKAADRKGCMEDVLGHMVADFHGPLFVLCQDSINGPKHKILCSKLGQDPKSCRLRPEAGVYHRSVGQYKMRYVDVKVLQEIESKLGLEAGNVFTTARLTACVLTPTKTEGKKLLLVSWHGPAKVKEADKQASFRRLVHFLERLRVKEACEAVVVGGDFNMPDHVASRSLQQMKLVNGAVLADYTTTSDRRGLPNIDYIVYWPQDKLHPGQTSVLCKDYRREKGNRPFDHPLVAYRFEKDLEHKAGQLQTMPPEE